MLGRRQREQRKLTERDLRRMNIGRRYWDASLDAIETDADHERILRTYAERIGRVRRRGRGLLFYGPNSAGKTYGSVCLLKHAVSWGYSAYCIMAADLKDAVIRDEVFEEDFVRGRVTTEQRIREVDFLLLEDVGKEYKAKSGFGENLMENLLRHRTRNMLPTIITTNLSLPDFRERYGRSTFEIARESLYPFEVRGLDEGGFRRRLAKDVARDLR